MYLSFLFTSLIALSQHERKEVLSLFDSIMAIEPYEQLYTKINTLQLENSKSENFIRLNDDHTKLKEYFFRQDLYKSL
jgi:regulator of sigma D